MNSRAVPLPFTPSQTSAVERCDSFIRKSGLFGLGTAFMRGAVQLENIEDVFVQLIQHKALPGRFMPRIVAETVLQALVDAQRGVGAFRVGARHYDLGNDLFSAMLDPSMSYTCGYWRSARTLAQAQEDKLEHLCRKLKLSPGMRVLDIGCGWGNFAYHAATRYSVSVVGLTVSQEQARFAQHRCADLPVEIVLQDYRKYRGIFDRVVSIEMVEAVGRKNLGTYFQMIHDCLKPQGLAVLQAISTESFSRYSNPATDQFLCWLRKYIFPDGYVPNSLELMVPARRLFVIEDLENFSADYERTLAAWRENFEAHWSRIAPRYGEPFRRMWLYYLGGCIAFFRLRMVQLFQIVYAKGGVQGGYRRE